MPATVDRRFWPILALSCGLHALCLLGLPGREAPPAGTSSGTPVAGGPLRLRAQLRPPPATAAVAVSAQTSPAAGAGAVGRAVLTPRLPGVGQALPPTASAGRPPRPGTLRSQPALATAMPGAEAHLPVASAPAMVTGAMADALSPLAATPAASPASMTPPAAAPAGEALLDAYRRQLHALVATPRDYPRLAALRGWEGEVRLRLRIARKGNLLAVQLDRSSGFDILDRHALAWLEQYGDFPPLPERWEGSDLQVVIPIHYKLRKTT